MRVDGLSIIISRAGMCRAFGSRRGCVDPHYVGYAGGCPNQILIPFQPKGDTTRQTQLSGGRADTLEGNNARITTKRLAQVQPPHKHANSKVPAKHVPYEQPCRRHKHDGLCMIAFKPCTSVRKILTCASREAYLRHFVSTSAFHASARLSDANGGVTALF